MRRKFVILRSTDEVEDHSISWIYEDIAGVFMEAARDIKCRPCVLEASAFAKLNTFMLIPLSSKVKNSSTFGFPGKWIKYDRFATVKDSQIIWSRRCTVTWEKLVDGEGKLRIDGELTSQTVGELINRMGGIK